MLEQIQKISDAKAGIALITTGASGSFIQAITEYANIFVTLGNAVIVLAGLFFVYQKFRWKQEQKRRAED